MAIEQAEQTAKAAWGADLGYPDWMAGQMPAVHTAFNAFNKYLSVPSLRMGLGRFMSTPATGYLMVLRTRGRKSGEWRDAPLGYTVVGDAVYCLAGFGTKTHWYQNILADSRVEVLLPSRSFTGVAEPVTDPAERLRVIVPLIRSMGIVAAGFGLGNAWRETPEQLDEKCKAFPLVRVRATGIAAGPDDPGGRFWVLVAALSGFVLVRWFLGRRRARGRARGCQCASAERPAGK